MIIAVVYSFNDGRSRTVWQGFSLRWWSGDPNASVLHDASMHQAIFNSLILAVTTVLIVLPIGISLAIGAHRLRGKASTTVQGLTSVPVSYTHLTLPTT